MRATVLSHSRLFICIVVLAFLVLGLTGSNVAASQVLPEQWARWPRSKLAANDASFPVTRGATTPLMLTRSNNGSLSPTRSNNLLAVQLLSYYMPPQNVGPVAVSGAYTYVGEVSDIDVFDVSNPVSPSLVNTYQSGETPFGLVGMIVSGTLAYVGYSSANLHVLDISQPMSPTLVGFYDGAGYAGYAGLMRVNNYIYLTTTSLFAPHLGCLHTV